MGRTFEWQWLEEVANSPSIRPCLGGDGPIRLQSLAENANNYVFTNEDGGFVVVQLQPGGTVFEVHTIFRPGSPGTKTIRFMRECIAYMFTATPCLELVTRIPSNNAEAERLANIAGFIEKFYRENVPKEGVVTSYRSIPLDRWVAACSTVREAGKAFHTLLENAKKSAGSVLPVHVDEEIHDRWVGAAMLMALQGNTIKAVNSYNAWASFAGYATIVVISEQPPVVDVQDAIIGVNGSKLEVLLCR